MSLSMNTVSYSVNGNALVSRLSLSLSAGEMVGLLGPNGAGKSTALKILSGDIKAECGRVELLGVDIHLKSPIELALSRSVMAQSANVVFDFTVQEIVEMGWVQSRILKPTYKAEAVTEVVALCELEDYLARPFKTLSGGEQQRVQFARNLLQLWRPEWESKAPRYLLLDEPTASMDIKHELALLRLARKAASRNIGVLVVLHDLNLAARFMDRVLLMNAGRLIAEGSPEEVLDADQLSKIYQTEIQVEHNAMLDRLVVHS